MTRYDAWTKLVRATRPALVCASPTTNMRVNVSSQLLVPHLRNSIGQKHLAQKVQPLACGNYADGPVRAATSVSWWKLSLIPRLHGMVPAGFRRPGCP